MGIFGQTQANHILVFLLHVRHFSVYFLCFIPFNISNNLKRLVLICNVLNEKIVGRKVTCQGPMTIT